MTNAERIIDEVLGLDPDMNKDCIKVARIAHEGMKALKVFMIADRWWVAHEAQLTMGQIERIASE